MRQLHPVSVEGVDPAEVYGAAPRAPHDDGRPWLLLNMVTSVDGATAVGGVSDGLGGQPDRTVFLVLRTLPDVILAAAGTVRAEAYGPPRADAATREARASRGQSPAPQLAIVSGSLQLDVAARFFTEAEPDNRPIVITGHGADASRLAAVAAVAEVVVAGEGASVDLLAAMRELGQRGARVVLCEGGPSLNGQLFAQGLVDEVCVTIGASVVGGTSHRLSFGPELDAPIGLDLTHVLEEDGTLLLRYVRATA